MAYGYNSFAQLAKAEGWDAATQHEELVNSHYDLYKEIHGIRPRWINYEDMSVEELVDTLIQLSETGIEQEKSDRQFQIDTKRGYSDADVQAMLHAGAPDHFTAVRWAKQANNRR